MCTAPIVHSATAAAIMSKEPKEDIEFLWKWRKYLLLLATLVASVTYVAGLNPPGGVWSEEGVDPPLPPAPLRSPQHAPPLRSPQHAPPPPAIYPNRVGDPVLVSSYPRRYTAFFYCNAAAFVASLVIIMFLLDRRISGTRVGLTVLRSAMLLDLLALMAAFAAGSCRDVVASIYVSALFALVFAYVAIHVRVERFRKPADFCYWPREEESHLKERRKFLLLLATFATPLTYGAGLVPPGGFWSETDTKAGQWHHAGAPLLHDGPYKIRYHAFFYANANSFVASLAIIMLLMSSTLSGRLARSYALPVCVLVELLGLMAAYAAGSCRNWETSAYVISLVGAVFLYIVLQVVIAVYAMGTFKQWRATVCRILTCANLPDTQSKQATQDTPPGNANAPQEVQEGDVTTSGLVDSNNGEAANKVEESRSLLLLLATLAATVTYQAGLSPPGGVWPEGHLDNSHTAGNPVLHDMSPPGGVWPEVDQNYTAGNPVLLDMSPTRYMAFYHCNTAAFVASLVVIIVVQSKELSSGAVVRRAALNTVMILDLFGLMGAYVAGSCRDASTTIYVSALAVAVFVYSIAKVVAYTAHGQSWLMKWVLRVGKKLARALLGHLSDDQPKSEGGDDAHLERKRKFLLQLAILAATVTYQTGLNPPGGFWPKSNANGDRKFTAGDPVLLDYYGIRYQVFFYCNATGFMASVAVILLLVNQTLSKQGIRSNALHICIMVGLLGLMGAYAAGSCRKLRTSIYVFALVAAVVAFLILQILLYVSADRFRWSELPWLPKWLKGLLEPLSTGPAGGGKNKCKETSAEQQRQREKYLKRKYLMLLGILAASVTYQAGLAPPGGTWGDDDTASPMSPSPSPSPSAHPPAGNPILLDSNPARYRAFFYCNATSFVASIVVIMLLLLRTVKQRVAPLWAMQTAVVLDLLGLLGAYAAGSCRNRETSAYVIALVVAVVVFIALYVLLSFDTVLTKVKKLGAWKYLGGSN